MDLELRSFLTQSYRFGIISSQVAVKINLWWEKMKRPTVGLQGHQHLGDEPGRKKQQKKERKNGHVRRRPGEGKDLDVWCTVEWGECM